MTSANSVAWNPVSGPTVKEFLRGISFLDETGRDQVLSEGLKIMGRCSNPSERVSGKCLLVLGEVQSGKTLSFSTVVALSRDNQIPVTVILAGTKKPLLRQTHAQVLKDFNIITNENDIGGLSDFTLVIGFDPSFKELFHLIEREDFNSIVDAHKDRIKKIVFF